ncbi:MAG TPA: hypothetical protein VJA21_29090 [Verrucomicrobiae bacterium]
MKAKLLTIAMAVSALIVVAVGCKKQEESTPPAETQKAADGVKSEAAKAAESLKTTAKEVTDQATAQVDAGQQQAQGLIDQAKNLVSQNKYQDAVAKLKELASTKLTPDQQKLVDDLKAKIQAALANTAVSGTNAASALGNMLGGKK